MSDHLNNQAPSATGDSSASSPSTSTLSDRVLSLRMPPVQQTPKPARSWLPWVLFLGMTGAACWLGYLYHGARQERQNQKAPNEAGADQKAAVAARQRELGPGDVVLENKGYIVPVHQIQVSPKVSGMVTKLHFKEGDLIKKGQLLVEFEDTNYRADRDRAKGVYDEAVANVDLLTKYRAKEIAQAKAKHDEAKAQLVQLENDKERFVRLKTTSAVNASEYDKSIAAFEAMQEKCKQLAIDHELLIQGPRDVNIQSAQARVQQAKADLDRAQWYFDNCKLFAPISGTVLSKNAEENNIVNQLSFNLKASVCDVADLTDIEVDLTVQERDVARVYKNQRCRVRSEAFPERIYNGFVSRLMPIADRAKGAVPVRVKVEVPAEEQGQYLNPDIGVIVSFFKDAKKNDAASTMP